MNSKKGARGSPSIDSTNSIVYVTAPCKLHRDSSRCYLSVTALQSDLYHIEYPTFPKQLHINSPCRHQSENATRVQHVSHALAYRHRNVQVYCPVSQVMIIGCVTSPWILGCVCNRTSFRKPVNFLIQRLKKNHYHLTQENRSWNTSTVRSLRGPRIHRQAEWSRHPV